MDERERGGLMNEMRRVGGGRGWRQTDGRGRERRGRKDKQTDEREGERERERERRADKQIGSLPCPVFLL